MNILRLLLEETSHKQRCLGYGKGVTMQCRFYVRAIVCFKISRRVSYFYWCLLSKYLHTGTQKHAKYVFACNLWHYKQIRSIFLTLSVLLGNLCTLCCRFWELRTYSIPSHTGRPRSSDNILQRVLAASIFCYVTWTVNAISWWISIRDLSWLE